MSRAASYFAHGGKVTKTPPGFAQNGHFVSIFALPIPSVASRHLPLTRGVGPGPHLRGLSLWAGIKFPARKICVTLSIQPGPTGALSLQKLEYLQFKFCAWVSYPCCRGGHHPAFPFRGRWHGEAVTDEGNGLDSPCAPVRTVGEGLAPPGPYKYGRMAIAVGAAISRPPIL